jgi:hypothetical protein
MAEWRHLVMVLPGLGAALLPGGADSRTGVICNNGNRPADIRRSG